MRPPYKYLYILVHGMKVPRHGPMANEIARPIASRGGIYEQAKPHSPLPTHIHTYTAAPCSRQRVNSCPSSRPDPFHRPETVILRPSQTRSQEAGEKKIRNSTSRLHVPGDNRARLGGQSQRARGAGAQGEERISRRPGPWLFFFSHAFPPGLARRAGQHQAS